MAPLSTTFLAALVVGELIPTLASPNPMEKRGDVIIFHDQTEFYERYGLNAGPACRNLYGEEGLAELGCVIATTDSTWTATTFNSVANPAEYIWLEDDATTASCLIHLHDVQKDECISVRGSVCEANKGTSKILNARLHSGGSLTAEESSTFQKASRALIGARINSDSAHHEIPSGVYLATYDHTYMSVVFGGAEQC